MCMKNGWKLLPENIVAKTEYIFSYTFENLSIKPKFVRGIDLLSKIHIKLV